jgi:putative membrane protein
MTFSGRWLFFFILHVLFWILVIIGVVTLIKYIIQPGQRQKDEALELLRKRYASGQISREEFEEKRKDLLKA